jgi:hypothetical protein
VARLTCQSHKAVARTALAFLMLLLMGTPAHAQTGRVLFDMTIQTRPGPPGGHCLVTDAGRLLVEARLAGENRWPVRFSLGPGPDALRSLNLRINTPETTTGMVRVDRGISCYALFNEATFSERNETDQSSSPEQPVAIRLIWLPLP